VISAIGHETDYTIADFVSDLRAPTPSAAGEIVIPVKNEMKKICSDQFIKLHRAFHAYLNSLKGHFKQIFKRLLYQERKTVDLRLRIEDRVSRMNRMVMYRIKNHRDDLGIQTQALFKNTPALYVKTLKESLQQTHSNLKYSLKKTIEKKSVRYHHAVSMLASLNPTAILERGYSITRTIDGHQAIRDPSMVHKDQELEIILAKGKLNVKNLR